jgi:hypothetical protein
MVEGVDADVVFGRVRGGHIQGDNVVHIIIIVEVTMPVIPR